MQWAWDSIKSLTVQKSPNELVDRTTRGQFVRPIMRQVIQGARDPDHFRFGCRWIFPTGVPLFYFSDLTLSNLPTITPVLDNCTVASADEVAPLIADWSFAAGGQLLDIRIPNAIIKLPRPINDGWVVDIGINAIPAQQYVVPSGGSMPPNFSPFHCVIFNAPESGREVLYAGAKRRFYAPTVLPQDQNQITDDFSTINFRWIRYYPTPGNAATATYIGVFFQRIDAPTARWWEREQWEVFYNGRREVRLIAHAHDNSAAPDTILFDVESGATEVPWFRR